MKNKKYILYAGYVLTFLVIIFAAQTVIVAGSPAQPTATVAPVEAVTKLSAYIQPAKTQFVKPVLNAIGWSLQRESVRVNNEISYVDFLAISTGNFYTLTLPIAGSTVFDVLDVYMPLKTGVVKMPIAIGVSQPDGTYLYFDAGSELPDGSSREVALGAAVNRLQRGQVIDLTIFKYVALNGVDWEKCKVQDKNPDFAKGCSYALDFSKITSATIERMFISKIYTDKKWFPVGWWFMITRDEQISLPDEE